MMIVYKKQEKGFTLIEILIAVALLAIMSAVVIPNVTGYLSKGEEQAYKADLAAVQAAVDNYYGNPSNRGLLGANKGKKLFPLQDCALVADEALCVSGAVPTVADNAVTATEGKKLIDFVKLTGANYLKSVPGSVSAVHTGVTTTGSYVWYVDATTKQVTVKWLGDGTVGFETGIYP